MWLKRKHCVALSVVLSVWRKILWLRKINITGLLVIYKGSCICNPYNSVLEVPYNWCPDPLIMCSQNGPPPPSEPLQIPCFMCRHSNCAVISVSNAVRDTARLVYRLPCSSLWVEISALAYESNSSCCPKRLSVAYCTHIIQTKLMLKNQRYPQKSMFLTTGVPTDIPLVVLG